MNCTGLAPVATKKAREDRREISRGTVALAMLPSREEMGAHYAGLGERIDGIVQAAEKAGSLAVAVQGLNSLRQNLDSISKLAGHMGGAPQVNVGVHVNISAGEIAAELSKMLRGANAKVIEAALDEEG
ncbi:hypothetical protein AMST5_03060 [freshwater sediment metagenome]|uniref:Uncharacterized protein n=1 Tax=freshwater sediment metagenome TaxID=556182 RepID=A0AA48M192_9ZZZZ